MKDILHCWYVKNYCRWWFQIFFIFTLIWGRFPFWLIFFKWVETTNQKSNYVLSCMFYLSQLDSQISEPSTSPTASRIPIAPLQTCATFWGVRIHMPAKFRLGIFWSSNFKPEAFATRLWWNREIIQSNHAQSLGWWVGFSLQGPKLIGWESRPQESQQKNMWWPLSDKDTVWCYISKNPLKVEN